MNNSCDARSNELLHLAKGSWFKSASHKSLAALASDESHWYSNASHLQLKSRTVHIRPWKTMACVETCETFCRSVMVEAPFPWDSTAPHRGLWDSHLATTCLWSPHPCLPLVLCQSWLSTLSKNFWQMPSADTTYFATRARPPKVQTIAIYIAFAEWIYKPLFFGPEVLISLHVQHFIHSDILRYQCKLYED